MIRRLFQILFFFNFMLNHAHSKLTVSEYLRPIKDNESRPSWPENLNFEYVEGIDFEKIKKILFNQNWLNLFHCDGKAIPANSFRGTETSYVEYNQKLIFDFYADNSMSYVEQNPNAFFLIRRFSKTKENPSLKPHSQEHYFYDSYFKDNAFYTFSLSFIPSYYRVVKVKETGEIVILEKTNELFLDKVKIQNKICPNGSSPDVLLVPYVDLVS